MICTIYSHATGFNNIINILKTVFPKGILTTSVEEEFQIAEMEIKSGLFRSPQKLKVSYRQRKVLSYQFPEIDDSPLTKNLKGLYGYVHSLPTNNAKIRELFLHKIQTLNAEFSIFQEAGEVRKIRELISKLAIDFDAILFVQPNTLISQSSGQHFLDKNLDLLIDREGNCAIDHLDVKINSIYFDGQQIEVTEDQKQRKAKSEWAIQNRGIKISKTLPVIESEKETVVRSSKEIAGRVSVLAVINMVAFGNIEGEEAIGYLEKYGLWELVTPRERAFLMDPTEEKKTRESWKCEGIYILLWALKIEDELNFPDTPISLDDMDPDQYPVGKNRDPNDFINAAREARTKAELLDVNDLYYRLDWACVDARLNDRAIAGLNPGVVYERHYALNWLINYMDQSWDDISCDT